jgi:hypothetical protein
MEQLARRGAAMTDLFTQLLNYNQSVELEDYLKRGRRLRNMPTERLTLQWAEQMRVWVGMFPSQAPRELNDILAEMKLRDIDPPLDVVKDEWVILCRKACALKDELRSARTYGIGTPEPSIIALRKTALLF